MSEYILNEAQEAWLKALESGEYRQAKGKLCRDTGHCCIGVACEIAGLEKRKVDGENFYEFDDSNSDWAPIQVQKSLKLRNDEGEIPGGVMLRGRFVESLAQANDLGITFSEIAAFIRSNPTAVFKE